MQYKINIQSNQTTALLVVLLQGCYICSLCLPTLRGCFYFYLLYFLLYVSIRTKEGKQYYSAIYKLQDLPLLRLN